MAPDYATEMRWTSEQRNAYYNSRLKSHPPFKVETKKERIKRIANELMLASWNLHDQVTLTMIKIKQYCKPRHEYKPLCGRAFNT